MSGLLSIRHLRVDLLVDGEPRPVIHDVTLDIEAGEAVALVGESGSGKSMTARAVSRLLPAGARVGGEISFDGSDVQAMDRRALRAYRTSGIGMVFQDPRAAVNPVRRIGDFLTEALVTSGRASRKEAAPQVVALLQDVGISDAQRRMRQYPHELSGGLLQRVMIASVVAMQPRLLIADEPTTALDVTTQAEVMAILDELRERSGMALLLITHDLELAAAVCDRTAVMYAGRLVEEQPSATLHRRPRHPYTAGLLASQPGAAGRGRLPVIPGRPRSGFEAAQGCPFTDRCPFVQDRCHTTPVALRAVDGALTACIRSEELGVVAWPSETPAREHDRV
jgi:oligopeptide/dipeptide ABC transporter ATP-binding protein